MHEVDCPYCEHTFELETADGNFMDEGEREEEQCPKCDKWFMVRSHMGTWYHDGEKADCLNGGEHQWRQIVGVPKEHFVGRQRCDGCDEERKVKTE